MFHRKIESKCRGFVHMSYIRKEERDCLVMSVILFNADCGGDLFLPSSNREGKMSCPTYTHRLPYFLCKGRRATLQEGCNTGSKVLNVNGRIFIKAEALHYCSSHLNWLPASLD